MLAFQAAQKSFGAHPVLGPISFGLDGPGVVGLVGPNGAGKSTTLRLAAGFFPPTSGRVLFCGKAFEDNDLELKCRLGYLPERPPIYAEMGVLEYLTFVGRLKRVGARDLAERRENVVRRCGLQPVRDWSARALSAGYRQRLGLAAALLPDPPLVLLDEPTTHLDPVQREETLALIADEGRSRAVLFSSHLLTEVESLCCRVLILKGGVLIAEGAPAEIRARAGGLQMRVRGPASRVCEALGALEGVQGVRLLGEGDGVTWVEVRGAIDGSRVAAAVLAASWELLELTAARGGIEAMLRESGPS